MLPNHAELINRIIGEFHGSKFGAHAGTTRTMARLSAQFFWPKMREDIRMFVKECSICQQAKVNQSLPADNSWEAIEEVQKAHPYFNLEDKVAIQDGSIVTRIKYDSIKGGETVAPSGHVLNKDEGMKGTHERRGNTKWRDFIQG
ncbi:uncharacterized protein LOC106780171 [Vigna radiata var. radiata]|uniref:Uncharacterized protein LOC106780171 n=1 Tax=Vigna radiata var. radiata TaxID=3916 RepID=A0A1S3VZU8_VIGRR|nr:uncharacterized protein LOC106780171 [Vigna radiata var. radiata]